MNKTRYTLMIVANIIDFILYIALFRLLGMSNLAILIVIGFIVVMFIYVAIKSLNKNTFGDEIDMDDNYMYKYKLMINEAEKLKGSELEVRFVKTRQIMNPAFYHRKTVFINKDHPLKEEYFEGMLAHELGHAISGFGDYLFIFSLSISTMIASLITNLRYMVIVRRKKKFHWYIDNLIYLVVMVLSYKDHLLLNRYAKEEEHLANYYALQLSNGHSLRTYYYRVLTQRKFQEDRFDLRHPSPYEMINQMEIEMDLTVYEKDVYHIDNKVYYINKEIDVENQKEARHNFYLHVADHDNEFVLNTLSNDFLRGNGTEVDYDKAIEYSLKSVEIGSIMALYNLGLIYEYKKEYIHSLKYLYNARNKELKNIEKAITRVEKKLGYCPLVFDDSKEEENE